jgi:TIR domain
LSRIAISYRRGDTGPVTGRIFDRLKAHFEGRDDDSSAEHVVFMDYDSTPLGTDFRQYIRGVLEQCEIMLAIIGPRWMGEDGADGPRIQQESDWVRIEIEAALNKKNVHVIPVLIDRTPMPDATKLPESIRDIVYRQATAVDSQVDFNLHMERLLRNIDSILGTGTGEAAAADITAGRPARQRRGGMRPFGLGRSAPLVAAGVLATVLVAGAAIFGWQRLAREDAKPVTEAPFDKYEAADLGVTFTYPRDVFFLNTTERRQGKIALANSDGVPVVTIRRNDLPAGANIKLAQQNEVDELKRNNVTPTYIAPEKEQNWSNWYVISGLSRGNVFYYRRWYTDDSIVSIEFFFPADMKPKFDPWIPKMTRELSFSRTRPRTS